jgi:hypothetical protein
VTWDHRKFGTASDPLRQSALNAIASEMGCARRYQFDRIAEATGTKPPESANWRRCLGTAIHAVIDRALTKTWPQMVAFLGPDGNRPDGAPEGWAPKSLRDRVDEVLREELAKAAGEGRRVEWYEEDPEGEIAAGVAMVLFAIRTTVERAEEIVGSEVPFAVEVDGMHIVGTLDLVYRRRGDRALGLADWKSGERKLPQVVLDFGYQPSTYALALERGALWPGTERETRLNEWPSEIHIVHLRDGVPYVRKPKTPGKSVGDLRGPGWYPSQRTAHDVARLRVSLRTVVGTVRMGRFVEAIGQQCERCQHKKACLSDGYGPSKDEQRAIAAATRGIEFDDGLDGEAA